MPTRKVLTLHRPMAPVVAEMLLAPARDLMIKFGFRWWMTLDADRGITLMIDCPQEWIDRSPSEIELKQFFALYEDGAVDEAQQLAKTGLPPHLR